MNKDKIEFGDFQTPLVLASQICEMLSDHGVSPRSVLEPTCGRGNILFAAVNKFNPDHAIGVEYQPQHLLYANTLAREQSHPGTRVEGGDFFQIDWEQVFTELPEPLLIVGNPPWVTNSKISIVNGSNLPAKTNFLKHKGLDAITGKANFDISEWMMICLLDLCNGRDVTLSMLLKTSVARKTLSYAWSNRIGLAYASIHEIDSKKHFGASVSACLLSLRFSSGTACSECRVFPSISSSSPCQVIGFENSTLVANIDAYRRTSRLIGRSSRRWRSGVKHDCSKVMELREDSEGIVNGFGEKVNLEQDYLYPLLKTSDVANNRLLPNKWMILPQRTTGEDTSIIESRAPLTWAYLQRHGEALDRRKSSIYKKRARFSIFGIGDYSLTDWKIAISGFYRSISFVLVGPHESKPVVFDDATYFLPCKNRTEGEFLVQALNSSVAQDFFSSYIFWDSKRPITVDLLSRLHLEMLLGEMGYTSDICRLGSNEVSLWDMPLSDESNRITEARSK